MKNRIFSSFLSCFSLQKFPEWNLSEDKSRLKHTRRGIEVVITGLTRKRSDFSEPSAQKILEFFGFFEA